MQKSTTAKNGQTRVVEDRDNNKHLEFFTNGSWFHSPMCKEIMNDSCTK
jgi:hypothetical protein